MPKRTANKTSDVGVAALRDEMARRGWSNADLATKLGVGVRTVTNGFASEWSSRSMREKVNALFGIQIFTEGVG